MSEKETLRRILIQKRAATENRAERTHAAMERILPLIGSDVMLYAPIGGELDTSELFRAVKASGKNVFLPYTSDGVITPKAADKLCAPDRYGNLPRECYIDFDNRTSDSVRICVVPLVGVNSRGFRLGYGKGCYDRFFAKNKHIYKIGLCFDCQIADFAEQPHDIPLDRCVTETKVIYF